MNAVESKGGANLRPVIYWWLWLLDAVVVSAGVLFYLATHYGTCEFLGITVFMALLPFIPVMVLVGGAGSTVFALTKIWIEKRSLPRPAAVALLVGPALVVGVLVGLWGANQSPGHRLAYICLGNTPAPVSQVRVAGYSAFLRGEWVAVFTVEEKAFQTLVAKARLAPADPSEFNQLMAHSTLKATEPLKHFPAAGNFVCFKRVFKESEEHERGSVYALYDAATSTAMVFRGYHD